MLPGGFVCSGSFKGRVDTGGESEDAVRGKLPLRQLFSKAQRAVLPRARARRASTLDSLVPLGPTFLLKATFAVADGPQARPAADPRRRAVAVPGRLAHPRAVDQVPADEAFQVAGATRAYLAEKGIVLAGVQQTKTKTALEYYSAQLTAGA